MAAPLIPIVILAAGGLVAFAMSKKAGAAPLSHGQGGPPQNTGDKTRVTGESGTSWEVKLIKQKSDGAKVYDVIAPSGTFGPHADFPVLQYEVGTNGLRTFVKSYNGVSPSILDKALSDFPMVMPGSTAVPSGAKVAPAGSTAAPSAPAILAQPAKVTKAAITAQSPGQPQVPDEPEMPLYLREALAKALAGLGVNEYGQLTGPVDKGAIQAATSTAAILESAGFPGEAKLIRDYVRNASVRVPSPPKAEQVPLPGLPAEWQDKVNRMIAMERDPKKLRALAEALRMLPSNPQTEAAIEMLETLAAQQEELQTAANAMGQVEEVIKSPGLPPVPYEPPPEPIVVPPKPAPPTPAPVPKSPVEMAASDMRTHLLTAQRNLGMAAAKKKYDKNVVLRFQRAAGIDQDGKPGPGTMLSLASYESDLPLVMFWPVSANRNRVQKYRNDLRAMAARSSEPRASELRQSAARESGQGGIVQAGPALT